MMFGLGQSASGQTTVTSASTTGAAGATTGTAPTFTTGLELWGNPSTAFSAIPVLFQNASAAFSSQLLPFTAGVLLPPLAAVGIVIALMASQQSGGHRR